MCTFEVLSARPPNNRPSLLPIPGTLSLAHVEENLGALSLELPDTELRAIAVA